MMIPATVFLEPKQESKIATALRRQKGCRIKIRKPYGPHCEGLLKGEMLLRPCQWKKYQKAASDHSIAFPFQHKQLAANIHHKGGFLPLLALLAPILGGVAGGLIEKEIGGSGIHPPKLIFCKRKSSSPSIAFQIDPAPHGGEGLYLTPWKGGSKSGTGLYLSPYPHKAGSGLRKLHRGMFSRCTQFSNPQKKSLKSLVDLF